MRLKRKKNQSYEFKSNNDEKEMYIYEVKVNIMR